MHAMHTRHRKKKKIALFLFIDALGWEVLKAQDFFLDDLVVDKKPLRTILGYSSACDPSIISGLLPSQHGYWSSYYYSPHTSPFSWEKWLRVLPSMCTDHHRIRSRISQLMKRIHGFTGYFQLYNVPFSALPRFDYAEKSSIWEPEGIKKGRTIFDLLAEREIPYYVDDSGVGDEAQFCQVEQLLQGGKIDFAYVMLGKLDALMHGYGTKSSQIDRLCEWYDEQIRRVLRIAEKSYEEVAWYVFSDHGMHNVCAEYDLRGSLDSLGLCDGEDYVAFYDSTMARFWYRSERAREVILEHLLGIKEGCVLSEDELRGFGVFFPDFQYGETIFLMNPQTLIVPSYMGRKAVAGMHGYHPNEAESYAAICSNKKLPEWIESIEHIFQIMLAEMERGGITKR